MSISYKHGIMITCRCGHVASIDLFTNGFPLGHFQCPACDHAVRKVKAGVERVGDRLIPRCKVIQARSMARITGN